MPERSTLARARKDKREGKAASTQAGEFVREEIEHVREGRHGARSAKQAIAIGLSKARRAGVDLPPPKKGRASEATRKRAADDEKDGERPKRTVSPRARRPPRRRWRASRTPRLAHRARQAVAQGGEDAAGARAVRSGEEGRADQGAGKRSAAARKAAKTRARQASTAA